MITLSNERACDAFHIQINVRLDPGCWFRLVGIQRPPGHYEETCAKCSRLKYTLLGTPADS